MSGDAGSSKQLRACSCWKLAVVLMLGVARIGAIHAQPPQAETFLPGRNFSGAWEGIIEDAVRPIVIQIDFDEGKAKFDSAGSESFPIEKSVNVGVRLGFKVQIGGHRFDFDGKSLPDKPNEIRGTVHFSARDVPFWLRRLPKLPAPKGRVEAWQQDLDALISRFLLYDRSFPLERRRAFRQRIDALRPLLKKLSDQAIMVEVARALALADNGHTRLYLLRNRTEVRQLPIRVWWFRNRLHIVRAASEHADLVGCRILTIGAASVEKAFSAVRGIDSGSNSWQRYMSSYFLTSPDVLYGAGIIQDANRVTLGLACGDTRRDVELAPSPLHRSIRPDEAWWNLAPSHRHPDYNLIPALRSDKAPLYLQRPEENYWFQYIPENRVLYVQFNRSQEMPSGTKLKQFTETVAQALEIQKPRALIFDLRFNTGGNLFLGTGLMKMIATHSANVPVFVITGRATFSAGISAAAQLKQWAHATIVGEPVGDSLDFWAEGGNLILPNSGLAAHYASGFHAYSTRRYPDRQIFVDLDVDSLKPDIAAEPSWSDYIEGTDVALRAIVERLNATRSAK
jgi:hypothetical protein